MNKKREVYTRREALLISEMHKKYDIARSQCLQQKTESENCKIVKYEKQFEVVKGISKVRTINKYVNLLSI